MLAANVLRTSRQHEIRPEAAKFTFIQCSNPAIAVDHKIQKTIRQHVMRDIGRSRRKRPRYQKVDLKIVNLEHNRGCTTDDAFVPVPERAGYSLPPSNPTYLPGIDLTVNDRKLLHFSKKN